MEKIKEAIKLIKESKKIVFLTGAGVSTLSGIPDYRSLKGIYNTNKQAEYLLSHSCFINEQEEFYNFVKQLYHLDAKPNIIHQTMAKLDNEHEVTIITQNIDDLHLKANSKKVLLFHGSLYNLYCTKCGANIDVKDYLNSNIHQEDNGIIRPDVVLYEEGLNPQTVDQSIRAIRSADLIVVVGTSMKVYPFAGLIDYKASKTKTILVNNEPTAYHNFDVMVIGDAGDFFKELDKNI
ncbi:MAG: NAD-dependent protein deacylase [Bacilli bacterium]|jgi:NAD-dependent deacetylase|nr:NAD-dependent protein deacylase [Bacilli bacterium]